MSDKMLVADIEYIITKLKEHIESEYSVTIIARHESDRNKDVIVSTDKPEKLIEMINKIQVEKQSSNIIEITKHPKYKWHGK